ncbi:MAG: hypothetical protein LBT14_07250 [Treponema sp.]|jgi:hypothetical protein|nr:hypothetical protein [Treponema sp.]
MPRISGPYYITKRKDTKKFQITLYPASGLPLEVCAQWQRRSFLNFPPELALFREPKTKGTADTGAVALIEYLKKQVEQPPPTNPIRQDKLFVPYVAEFLDQRKYLCQGESTA